MRIALVILDSNPARGGAERYTVDLAAALAANGCDVSLLSAGCIAQESIVPHPQLPYRQVRIKAGGITRLQSYRQFIKSLDAHLAANRYDIVHAMLPVPRCDVYHPHAGIAAQALASGHLQHAGLLKQRVWRLANRLNRKRRAFAQTEKRLLTGPTPPVVLCLSDYIKAEVRRHYTLGEDRLVRLFNAVDISRFDPNRAPGRDVRSAHNLAANDIVALMIAQDFARKGLAAAIAALALVADARLHLVVVGKGEVSAYQRLANSLGIAQRVIFAGPTDDPHSYYRAADFFVLPTRHDPCSLVVLEALAMGLPVITTRLNGAAEAMTEETHGFVLADPADTSAIASAMRQMLDANRRKRISHACLALRPRLSQTHHVDQLLAIYRGIAKPG